MIRAQDQSKISPAQQEVLNAHKARVEAIENPLQFFPLLLRLRRPHLGRGLGCLRSDFLALLWTESCRVLCVSMSVNAW